MESTNSTFHLVENTLVAYNKLTTYVHINKMRAFFKMLNAQSKNLNIDNP
jgi:hypothetical protein